MCPIAGKGGGGVRDRKMVIKIPHKAGNTIRFGNTTRKEKECMRRATRRSAECGLPHLLSKRTLIVCTSPQ